MPAHSLYVHIPFCSSICRYCDFVKLLYKDEWAFPYVDALLGELNHKYPNQRFKTIYVGGGTPNCLSLELLKKLLFALKEHLEDVYEWTVECNPEFVNEPLAGLLVEAGVNRVSMGMETSSKSLLEAMGRHHDFAAVCKAVALLKRKGISNISIDMIYALPNQTEETLKEDLQAILSLGVPHISAYSYIQEDHSIWTHQGVKEASQDIQGAHFEIVESALSKAGYEHYEISSYCRKNAKSLHNLTYWRDEEYGAIGLGASGYERGIRYKNTVSLPRYLKGAYLGSEEKVSDQDDVSYYLLTHLRLKEGFRLAEFAKRFGFDIAKTRKGEIDEEIKLGLLEMQDGFLRPTDKGMRLLDSVLLKLI